MGITAENLAEKYQISRTEQDEFAARSQELALQRSKKVILIKKLCHLKIKAKKETVRFDRDEHPRKHHLKNYHTLKPVFKANGTVTAGNSSGRNDGASALLVMSEEAAAKQGLKPKRELLHKQQLVFPLNSWGLDLYQRL